jgi:hypothetical protein
VRTHFLACCHLLIISSYGGGEKRCEKRAKVSLLIKALITFRKALFSCPIYLPCTLPLNNVAMEAWISTYE